MAKQNIKLLQVLIRQIGQDAVVYRVIAKRGLVLLKAKAKQPACHVLTQQPLLRLAHD